MKTILLFLLISTSISSFCQIGSQTPGNITSGSNFGFIQGNHLPDSFLKSNNKTFSYKDINGTPYIVDKKELVRGIPTGKLYTSDFELINTLFIRYNAFADNMEISKIDDGIDYYLLKKKSNAWYIVLGNNKYRAYNYPSENQQRIGFFVIVSENDTGYCALLKKEKVIFKNAKAEQNAFITSSGPSFVKTKGVYFIKIGDALSKIPKKKKDFVNLFIINKDLLKKPFESK